MLTCFPLRGEFSQLQWLPQALPSLHSGDSRGPDRMNISPVVAGAWRNLGEGPGCWPSLRDLDTRGDSCGRSLLSDMSGL